MSTNAIVAIAHSGSTRGALTAGRIQTETWAGCIVSVTTVAQLAAERVERHLVAQARRERLERSLSVVLAPEEAAVHQRLDASARRTEERRDRQRRAGDRQIRRRAQHQLQQQARCPDRPRAKVAVSAP